MRRLVVWMAVTVASSLLAQDSPGPRGTEPKKSAAEYPVHGAAGSLEIGADFMVHTFGTREQSFFTQEYLVVEVALYSGAKQLADLRAGQFTLRINGKKQGILPDVPGMVANSLKYNDWQRYTVAEGSAGAGPGDVSVGAPRPQTERFPGDPRPTQGRLPAPPKAPAPGSPGGIERPRPETPWETAIACALPEGNLVPPVSGYLFYHFSGKVKSIELVYTGPEGSATLVLRQAVK